MNPQEIRGDVVRKDATAEVVKAKIANTDGQPQVGMIVLYRSRQGSALFPGIVSAVNFDGTFDVTVFGQVVLNHKSIKPGLGDGQFRSVPAYAPFVLLEPVVPGGVITEPAVVIPAHVEPVVVPAHVEPAPVK